MFLSHSFMSIPYNPKQIKYINQKISGLSPDVRRFSNLYSQTRRRPCKSSVFIQISMIPKSLHKTRSTGYHINHELIWTYAIFMFSYPNHQPWTHQRQDFFGFLFLPWCSPWRLGTLTCASLKVHHRRWWSVAQSRSTLSLGSRTEPLVNVYIANWKDPLFLMGQSTILTGPFSIAFCMFTRG